MLLSSKWRFLFRFFHVYKAENKSHLQPYSIDHLAAFVAGAFSLDACSMRFTFCVVQSVSYLFFRVNSWACFIWMEYWLCNRRTSQALSAGRPIFTLTYWMVECTYKCVAAGDGLFLFLALLKSLLEIPFLNEYLSYRRKQPRGTDLSGYLQVNREVRRIWRRSQDPPLIEASGARSDTPHSVGFLWTSDRSDAETSIWQHTTLKRQKPQCPQRDSNPQSQQTSGRRTKP
jgi:hypothetical protein